VMPLLLDGFLVKGAGCRQNIHVPTLIEKHE
jgi:hypothetical protein